MNEALDKQAEERKSEVRTLTVWQPRAVTHQLRILAAEQDRSQRDLISEALNDLFRKYNRPEIAEGSSR